MSKYFYCQHCGKKTLKNPRLKGRQYYCGSKSCQQYRKNRWEKEKLRTDSHYHDSRLVQKTRWRKHFPGHEYQRIYRKHHPEYEQNNRHQQLLRKTRLSLESKTKIVKTDTLTSTALIPSGLYEIYPYKSGASKKIVKTDALIVELKAHSGIGSYLDTRSG